MNNSIPPYVLHQLNEYTKSGFLLFYADTDGNIQVCPHMDDELTARGIMSVARDFLKSVRDIEKNEFVYKPQDEDGETGDFRSED